MSNRNNYESMLWKVLEKEGLADLSQFHQPHFFDEVPLYSRESDISFLSGYTSAEASGILLRFALKLLKSVISYEEHRTPYLAAITVWSSSDDDPIVPNLFLWSGPVQKLKGKLTLDVAATAFGKKMKRLVGKLALPDRFEILEDTSTAPDLSRVFIAPARLPYEGFVALDKFRRPASRV